MNKELEVQYAQEKEKALGFLDWDAEWDGYSAEKIDKDMLDKQFLAFDLCLKSDLPMPRLIPNSAGVVEITWRNHGKEAYIIYDKDDGYLVCSLSKNGFYYSKEYDEDEELVLEQDFINHIKTHYSLDSMNKSLERLDEIKKCQYGWDGKDAKAMTNQTYENAKRFIMARITEGYGIFLNYEGEVIFDYFNEDNMKEVSLEIGENVWRLHEGEEEMVFKNPVSFCGRVSWLVSQKV